MKTKNPINYWTGHKYITIPAGTRCDPARNLPGENLYFARGWRGMSREERGWKNNYGFLLNKEQIKG